MGLQQFERRLERLVEGVFARAFRSGLQPVELARRLVREMDRHRTVGVRGVAVPNRYRIALSPADAASFSGYAGALAADLAEGAREHAREEGYAFVGPVEVVLEEDAGLGPGTFLVAGEFAEAPGGAAGALVVPGGGRVAVGEAPVTIGRLPECRVALDDPGASRRHAEVRRRDGAVWVVDLGSTNGTRVNGAAVREAPLSDGDEITVGTTTLRFEAS